MQEAIAQNFLAQYGALGGLALSGWVVAFIIWREYKTLQKIIIELSNRTIQVAEEDKFFKEILVDRIPKDLDAKLDKIGDELSTQELIKEYMNVNR